jgi:hypothetical protein
METITRTKDRSSKGSHEQVFQQLRLDVKDIVRELEPERKWEIKFKAILFHYGI